MSDLPEKPAQLDRAALERVLARAAELQSSEGDGDEPGLSDAQLVEIAREVGLAPANIRQAIAEERSRLEAPEAKGAVDHLFGAATARALRTLRGTPAEYLTAADAFMQLEEGLRVKRSLPDRVLWERAAGLAASLKRKLDFGGRGYHLTRAHEVSATIVAVDAQRTLVRLEASLTNVRNERMAGGAALIGIGAVATGVALVLGLAPIVAAVPVVVAAAIGWIVARGHKQTVMRAQLALEQVLDRLERRDTPRPSLLDAFGPEPRARLLKPSDR